MRDAGDRADTESDVRLRDRPVAHQLAVWWGAVGAVAGLVSWVVVFPFSLQIGVQQLVVTVVAAAVPAVGAWLAARPSTGRAQVGLVVLATWGLLALPFVAFLVFGMSAGHLGAENLLKLVPVIGLVLAGWALDRGGGLPWVPPAGWGRRLAGLGVGVYGLVAALPATVLVGAHGAPSGAGLLAGPAGGFWARLLPDEPGVLAGKLALVVVAAALGVAVARLHARVAIAPAAIVAVHALAGVARTLLASARADAVPPPGAELSVHPAFAVHVAAALAAVAATVWLASRARHSALRRARTEPPVP